MKKRKNKNKNDEKLNGRILFDINK